MKKWIILGIAAFVMIFEFQNCDSGNQTVVTSNSPNTGAVSAAPRPAEAAPVFDVGTLAAVDSYSAQMHLKYRIDLPSLTFKLLDDNGNLSAQTYCFTDEEKQAIDNTLYHAQICGGHHADEGRVCAAVYTPAYARLVNDHETLALGEATSACETGPDLCDEASQNLRDILDSLNRSFLQQGLAVRACQ